ncbi:dTDP-4-dehydrorhamnose reductase [Rahnella laticis]|uniref:dTDP-4-dehydrorhamnose reductase n=1 Tax=Rahnella laticis TaxID=2787622 RepID=UPI0018A27344|nr:dTDP-4-dehydrorhamnose reductase [Rahnella laticis]MBF7993289.1 dTDP-4-dehydrorhamnose reductase [Rahnella laticis]
MRVLLTGANGQLGRCIQNNIPANWELLAEDKNHLDISDFISVKEIIDEFKPEVIINAAAYTAVDLAENEIDKANIINNLSAENLARIACKINATFIHISTDYVFDGFKNQAYSEEDQTNPLNVYGVTKLMGELNVLKACPKAIIIRTAWVFSEFGNNFVKSMLRLGRGQQNIRVVNDQFGAPTYAGDVAQAIITLSSLENKPSGIFHFTGNKKISWYEFALRIFEYAKNNDDYKHEPIIIPISTSEYQTPAKRPTNSILDCSRIEHYGIRLSNWSERLREVVPLIISSE